MGRHSTMIPINGEAFKTIVQSKRTLASLESCLDVSKQAINAWIAGNKIPPRKLSVLAKELHLTSKELVSITLQKRERPSVLFKSYLNKKLDEKVEEEVIQIAEEYFKLDNLIPTEEKEFSVVSIPSVMEMAEYLEKKLGVQRGNIDSKQVIGALRKCNISVLFHSFTNSKIRALCVKKKNRYVIFINSQECLEDVCWRIFHEVCHIFSGHTDHSNVDESLCDKVATEMVTPLGFFETHKKFFREHFLGEFNSGQILIIDELTNLLGAGFFGIVLRLGDTKAISSKSFSGLQKHWNLKRKLESPKVIDIAKKMSPEDNLVSHWENILSDPDKNYYLHFQVLIIKGLIQGNISYERASELIGLDIKSTQELSELWLKKINNEATH